jgi:hypothetical protein
MAVRGDLFAGAGAWPKYAARAKQTAVQLHEIQKISFLPAIAITSARMHREFFRLLFLQAHRETEAYFVFMGTPAQPDQGRFRLGESVCGVDTHV